VSAKGRLGWRERDCIKKVCVRVKHIGREREGERNIECACGREGGGGVNRFLPLSLFSFSSTKKNRETF
jgi:hypothetical protein